MDTLLQAIALRENQNQKASQPNHHRRHTAPITQPQPPTTLSSNRRPKWDPGVPLPPKGSFSRIVELAHAISYHTAVLDRMLRFFGMGTPSFGPERLAVPGYTQPLEETRRAIEEASVELAELVRPARGLVWDGVEKGVAVAVIAKFKIAQHVPKEGSISFTTLSEHCGIGQGALEVVLRLAMAYRIFIEESEGRVAHTAASLLLTDDSMIEVGEAYADGFLPIIAGIPKALARDPQVNEPRQAAGAVLHIADRRRTYFALLHLFPNHDAQALNMLPAARSFPGLSYTHLVNNFDWASLPPGSICVDLGGSQGHAALTVTQAFPHLKWVVEDQPQNLPSNQATHPNALVTFFPHDISQPQPPSTREARVFLLRGVLHTLPDHSCRSILRALIPSLRSDTRILIMEKIMAPPGALPLLRERQARERDLGLLALGNGRERDMTAWRRLLVEADPELRRFEIGRVVEPVGSEWGILEVGWKGRKNDDKEVRMEW